MSNVVKSTRRNLKTLPFVIMEAIFIAENSRFATPIKHKRVACQERNV